MLESNRKAFDSIEKRYYSEPIKTKFEKKTEKVGAENILSYLTEMMQKSNISVEAITQQEIKKGRIKDAPQTRKAVAGNGFQGLVACALICLRKRNLIDESLVITLKAKKHKLIESYATIKTFTPRYRAYAAMMIPQIAERLLEKYAENAKLLFGSYCGTGTSLPEANLKSIEAIDTDLKPLARLIAKTKRLSITILEIKNIDYWFNKSVQEKLAVIKNFIKKVEDKDIANLYKIAFSQTLRESSFTRNSEFKLFRMATKQMEKFNPDAFSLMQDKLAIVISKVKKSVLWKMISL